MMKILLALTLPLGTMADPCNVGSGSSWACKNNPPSGSNCVFEAGSTANGWTKSCTSPAGSSLTSITIPDGVATAGHGMASDPCMAHKSSSSHCVAPANNGGEAKKRNLNCAWEKGSHANKWKSRCTFLSFIVPLAAKPADKCSVGKASNWACTNPLGVAQTNGLSCEFHRGHYTPTQGRNGETCTHWWCSSICQCKGDDCTASDAVKAESKAAASKLSVIDYARVLEDQAKSDEAATLVNQAKLEAKSESVANTAIALLADKAEVNKATAETEAKEASTSTSATTVAAAATPESEEAKRDKEWLLPSSPIPPTPVSPGTEVIFHIDMFADDNYQCNPKTCVDWVCIDWCHCFETNPFVEQMFNSVAYGPTLSALCPVDASPCFCP